MLIHAHKRTEATPVNLHGLDIVFEPNAAGHAVAEVTHEAAVQRLLSIPEAFCAYAGGVVVAAPVVAAAAAGANAAVAIAATAATAATASGAPAAPAAPVASAAALPVAPAAPAASGRWADAEIELAEDRYVATLDVIAQAMQRAGLSPEAWNAQPQADIDARIQAEVDTLRAGLRTTDADDEAEEERERQATAAALAEAQAAAATATATVAVAATAAAAGGVDDASPDDAPETTGMTITYGTETIDIGAMTIGQVRAFAADKGVAVPTGRSTRVAELRRLLFEGLNQGPGEGPNQSLKAQG